MQDVQSEDRIGREEDTWSLEDCRERTVLEGFVWDVVEKDISVPLS